MEKDPCRGEKDRGEKCERAAGAAAAACGGASGRPCLLIVDDEPAIVGMLEEFFSMEGFCVRAATSGEKALELAGPQVDLVLLDVSMPGMDGLATCRRLRERLSCPIVFLTARVEDADQLDGFAAGADDYVTKPFSLAVLLARVRAHLARSGSGAGAPAGARADVGSGLGAPAGLGSGGLRRVSGLVVDHAARTVEVAATGTRVELTRTEFDIVALLSARPGQVFDRDLIYERVWGWDATGDASIVREHVRRVRAKLAAAGADASCIETVWGVGYRWARA